MAIIARIDRIDTMKMQLRHGAIVALTRRMRVTGLTGTDWTALIQAMDQAGIPEDQSTLPEAPNLVLTEKEVSLVDESTADVDCKYEHLLNDGQEFGVANLPFDTFVGRVRATAVEEESNKDKDGNGIVLKHTFPSTDEDYPGQEVTQGGKFKVFGVGRTVRFEGLKQHNKPWIVEAAILGKVNSKAFMGGEARKWMCVACDSELFDATPPIRYKFAFEFQYKKDGWDPTVFFVDPRTGLPPINLDPVNGIKTVQVHSEADFEKIMGTKVQGG